MANKVVALAGGVGGAKLAEGLALTVPAEDLTIIVNTGDDFRYLGLAISPDLDTVCYTLAGLSNPQTGWGRKDETWNVQTSLAGLNGPNWFQLGDRDMGTHLLRTEWLKNGVPLSEITGRLCRQWNVSCTVLPMTDQKVQTRVGTNKGEWLDFQEYFVHQHWQPIVKNIRFDGANQARPAMGVLEAINEADLIIICPSNPLVSIDPILAIPGIKDAILFKPVFGVSPIVGGVAVKGPLGKMIHELVGLDPSAEWVADYYLQHVKLDGFLIDEVDLASVPTLRGRGIICEAVPSIMISQKERLELAERVLQLYQQWVNR